MKRTLSLILAALLLASAAVSCGKTEPSETNAPETKAPETEAVETNAPATDPVATDAPATNAPETEAPAPSYDPSVITENGVAYLFVSREMQEKFNLSLEDASASVSFMDSIKGSLCWIAFIEQGDELGTIRVRLRSRFVPVNPVAEQFRGGGHDCACGATVYNMEEVNALLRMADETVKEYKQTHEGWL